jgi:hypothetical protein
MRLHVLQRTLMVRWWKNLLVGIMRGWSTVHLGRICDPILQPEFGTLCI